MSSLGRVHCVFLLWTCHIHVVHWLAAYHFWAIFVYAWSKTEQWVTSYIYDGRFSHRPLMAKMHITMAKMHITKCTSHMHTFKNAHPTWRVNICFDDSSESRYRQDPSLIHYMFYCLFFSVLSFLCLSFFLFFSLLFICLFFYFIYIFIFFFIFCVFLFLFLSFIFFFSFQFFCSFLFCYFLFSFLFCYFLLKLFSVLFFFLFCFWANKATLNLPKTCMYVCMYI